MSAINEYYKQAELALASYANLTAGMSNTDFINALKVADLSATQASAFASAWNVVTQSTDPLTGVSATVFQAVSGGPKYLAIRGTQGPTDYLADYLILNGTPSTLNPQYQALKAQVQAWLGDGTLTSGFTVAGHSLGGYLAAGLVADFSAHISHAYLYNAPGNNSLISYVSQALGFSSTPDASKITSLRADAGISPISTLGNDFSPPIPIAIENQFLSDVSSPPLSLNHSQRVLTDALAVYALFSELAPTLSVSDMTALLKASSSQNVTTLESAAFALAKLFMPGTSTIAAENREALYTTLQTLQQNTLFKQDAGLVQVKLLGASVSSTVSGAQTDIAYRYALMQLNPFVVTGDSALYGVHNTGGQLDLYDETTGTGSLTKLYLQDRAAMLGWLNKTYIENTDIGRVYDGNAWYFKDEASGKEVWVGNPISVKSDPLLRTVLFGQAVSDILTGGGNADHIYGGGGDDIVKGADGNDYLEGGLGSDDLQGGVGRDTLHGGQGADVLEGGKGNDTLDGGAGYDLYILSAGDGTDIVLDTDGLGVIKFGTIEAKGSTGVTDATKWKQLGTDTWIDTQSDITYSRSVVGTETQLLIHKGNSNVVVKGWSEGELGIVLSAGAPSALPATSALIQGDHPAIDQDTSAPGIQPGYDALGNLLTHPGQTEARQDILYGSAGNDRLQGLSNTDYLDGRDGDDILEGGTGADALAGGQGADLLQGHDGNDILLGDHALATVLSYDYTKNASLIANITHTIEAGVLVHRYQISIGSTPSPAVGGADIIEGGLGDDLVFGGGGDDQIDGGDGADVVFGEGGNDILEGGIGNDILIGDTYGPGTPYADDYVSGGDGDDWVYGTGGNDIVEGGAGNDVLFGDGNETADDGADILIGGDGNDSFYGGGKDDILIGGAGLDTLRGEDGDDILDGGAGADYLEGGAGDDTYLGVTGDDTVFDTQGNNTIVLATVNGLSADSLAATVRTGSDGSQYMELAVTLDDGSVLKLDSPFFVSGSNTLQFANGDALDLETLVGEQLATPLNLFLDDAGGRVYGGAGNDVLKGGMGDDTLAGHHGDDTLTGNSGADILDGGKGNNTLEGGAGDDTYRVGTGNDLIIDTGPGNRLELVGLAAIKNVSLQTDALGRQNMTLTFADGATATIRNGFLGAVDTFAVGGTDLNIAAFLDAYVGQNLALQGSFYADRITGGAGNDLINGYAGDDALDGGRGNDQLYGGDGADILRGGMGGDRLVGGNGADKYAFGRGDGSDIIASAMAAEAAGDEVQLGADITSGDLLFYRLADGSLLTRIDGTQDSLRFEGWFTQGASVTGLRLNDTTLLDASEMSARAVEAYGGTTGDDVLEGTNADDRVLGYTGNDILRGGAGNDVLEGGDGMDAYRFGWTSLGNDVAVEVSAGASVIALTDGTTLADLQHEQVGSDLMLSFQGGGATLTLKDYFASSHDWTIQDEGGVTTGVADWLVLPNPVVDLAQMQAEFVDAARAQWAGNLLGNTYDSFYGKYVRINADAYRAESVSAYETKIITQQFTLVDYAADDAIIKRQSESTSYSSTMIDLLSGPPLVSSPEDTLMGLKFISIDEWTQRLGELGVSGMSLEGLIPVYGNGGSGLVGFLVDDRISVAPEAIPHHWQTNGTLNNQLERIQGGNSDNIIEGYRYATYSDEVSMIDGGGGNDTLYLPGIPSLSNEGPYFTDNESRIGGFAYGNTGDDTFYGGYYRDTLVGGDGMDLLDGKFSQDTYVMFAGESGTDTIWDTGTQLEQWAHYFITGYTVVSHPSSISQPIAQDMLRLAGINQADISFTWNQRVVEGLRDNRVFGGVAIPYLGQFVPFLSMTLFTQTMHAVLTLSWTGGGVNIVLPNSTDLAGMGLERIQFDDGTVMSMAELIALANPSPTLNPQELDNVIIGQLASNVIYGEGGHDTLYGGIDSDILNGGLGDDALLGGAGDDTYIVDSAADAITENLNDGIDSVQSSATYTLSDNVESLMLVGEGVINGTGNTLGNTLTGNSAANILMGDAGNDRLDGRLGNDTLVGGSGNDTYIFARDSGQDTINSYDTVFGKIDTIEIDWSIDPSEVLVSHIGNDLVLSIANTTDTLTIYQYLANNGVTPYSVEQIMFYDGTIWNLDIIKTKLPDNLSPQVTSPLLDQIGAEDAAFSYTLDSNAFTDPDAGDILAYNATLADGTVLPLWLSFNGATRTFSGTPGNADVGSLNITVTATDTGGLNVSDTFDLTIASTSYTVIDGGNGIDTLDGSTSNDILNGYAGDDTINGHAGDDIIEGGAGLDILNGGAGNDTFLVNGDSGADVVNGGAGFDRILGSNADDSIGFWSYGGENSVERIDGGAGVNRIVSRGPYSQMDFSTTELINITKIEGNHTDDNITGSWGNDIIEGGAGLDILSGGLGNDTFLVNGDSGADVVTGGVGFDQIIGSNADDSIGFWSYGGENSVERIDGGAGVNRIVSRGPYSQMDFSTTEFVNIARIEGNATDDTITGSWGDDVIEGGAGLDILSGGLGNDTYILGRGDGTDFIVENDGTAGNTDIVQFLTGVTADQIWFQHIGNNLEASVIGTSDKLVINDWYLDSNNHIEQFKTADGGLTLLDSQVDNLVNAMASFAPPAAGQTTLPPDYQANLAPVIAANWQ